MHSVKGKRIYWFCLGDILSLINSENSYASWISGATTTTSL